MPDDPHHLHIDMPHFFVGLGLFHAKTPRSVDLLSMFWRIKEVLSRDVGDHSNDGERHMLWRDKSPDFFTHTTHCVVIKKNVKIVKIHPTRGDFDAGEKDSCWFNL